MIIKRVGSPKYLGVVAEIRRRIDEGHWHPGDKLPKERELVRMLGVSQGTVARAMRILTENGDVTRRRRFGTVVAEKRSEKKGVEPCVIRVIDSKAVSMYEDPHNWFISDQLHKGIVNANTSHQIMFEGRERLSERHEEAVGRQAYLLPDEFSDDERLRLKDHPLVCLRRVSSNYLPQNTVNFDDITSAFNGVDFLIRQLGHRSIAMVWGGTKYLRDNLAGYSMALSLGGIPFRKDHVFEFHGGKEGGVEAGRRIIKRIKEFDAIFSDTDLKALGLIEYLWDQGVKVPEDVSVLGMDDIPKLSEARGLSTVRRPFHDMGAAMLRLLERRISANSAKVDSVVMCGTVIQRETTRSHTP